MTPLGRRAVIGGLCAVAGAYVWAVLATTYMFYQKHGPDQNFATVLGFAAYAVVRASWFVLPIGVLLGAWLPRWVQNCTGLGAFVRGAWMGVGVAVIAGTLTTLMVEGANVLGRESWKESMGFALCLYVGSMSVVCSLWVGVWAVVWRGREPQTQQMV